WPPARLLNTQVSSRGAVVHISPLIIPRPARAVHMSDVGIEKPFCIAIIICNEVIEDKATSNKTLVSIFNTIGTPGLPCQHPRMFVMASFTDGRGRWPISFRITGPSGATLMQG